MTDEQQDPSQEPSFGEALEELEQILGRIESEEIDIDALAAELRRGTQLLDLCRGKVRRAEMEVTQIVQRLEEPDGDEPGPDPGDQIPGL